MLPFFMMVDTRLFRNTRWNALLMFIGYVIALLFLYWPPLCNEQLGWGEWCPAVIDSRNWANDFLGRTPIAVLWMFSSFVGMNIRLSGTTSKSWRRVGTASTFIFIVPVAEAILSHFPAPVGPSSWSIGFIIGLLYLAVEAIKHGRRGKRREWDKLF